MGASMLQILSKCNYSRHSSALDWPWCLANRLEFREFTKQVLSASLGTWPVYCVDICTGAGLYWHGWWRVPPGERQLLLRSSLTVSLSFVGSVTAMLVKYLSARDEF